LKNKITPPAISQGNAYSKGNSKRPPVDLIQALGIFEKSEFIENAFGKDVHQHLIKFYKNEIDTYERVVTKWEYSRYLDLI
jgi:glutamine synthetase